MLTVVADVEGKGVGSAMVMANLQATLHALIRTSTRSSASWNL